MSTAEGRRTIGRYEIESLLAVGGMGSVHRGVLRGPDGFARSVAIKRLHPHLLLDESAVKRFLREARLGACVRHRNVVPIVDVDVDEEPFLVMELVDGPTLARIVRVCAERKTPVPIPIAVAIVSDLLAGLHAAHEAKDDAGHSLSLVHRDVSPQNVLVGRDGVARLTDFGIARAVDASKETASSTAGKLKYMAPEQLEGEATRRTDVHAAAIVLWETLTGTNLRRGKTQAELTNVILHGRVRPPSAVRADVPPPLDEVVLRGLDRTPSRRFDSAETMRRALEAAAPRASATEVGDWVAALESNAAVLVDAADFARAVAGVDEDTPATAIDSKPPPPRRKSMLLAALLIAAAASAAAATVATRRSGPEAPARAALSLPPPAPAVAPPDAATAAPPAEPSAESSAKPMVAPVPTAAAPRRRKVEPATPPDCKTPYVILPDGRKHFRSECFRSPSPAR